MASKESSSDSSDSIAIQIMDESVNIHDIMEEESLLNNNGFSHNHQYETNNDFSMHDLENIDSVHDMTRFQHTRCDSPLTISNYGSREGSCDNSVIEDTYVTDSSNNLPTLSLDDISQLTKNSTAD